MFISILVLTVLGHWYSLNSKIRILESEYRTLAMFVLMFSGMLSANFVGENIGLTDFQATLPGILWSVVFILAPIVYEIFRKDEKK